MQILIKTALSVVIILAAAFIGKKIPAAAGLIGVMPLTGALVLVWMYEQSNGNPEIMQHVARGALWGLIPSILFFLVAFLCFKKQLPLPLILTVSFGAWLLGALIHQWLLK